MKKVFEKAPDILFSISSITRPMRVGEVEGEKYNFISRERFEEMIANDELLEHNVFVGNYYGTPKAPVLNAVNDGKNMLIEVDVNGAYQILEKIPDAVSIFIMPPSLEILKARLTGRRTDEQSVIDKRLFEALREISCAKDYDYIVVNDDLETAANEFVSINKFHSINGRKKIIISSDKEKEIQANVLSSFDKSKYCLQSHVDSLVCLYCDMMLS